MQENELKLSGLINNQLKYVGDATNVLEKLYKSLDLLNIAHDGSSKEIVQRDRYFDTRQRLLERGGCSLRIRENKSGKYLTAKKPISSGQAALKRHEYEEKVSGKGDVDKLVADCFRSYFPEYAGEPVSEILQVKNTRYQTDISTPLHSYALCFDKYEYFCRQSGEGGDPQYEIEIEQIDGDDIDADPDIKRLSTLLTDLLGFQVESRSKYQKGVDWLDNKEKFEERIFILFDFVAYSKKTSSVQRQLVRDFMELIREPLEEHAAGCVKIPIGDGMILGCPVHTHVIALLNNFFRKLRQHNRRVSEERHLEIRTALHTGPIYEYTDINGNLNYAGSGINITARIASKAEPDQVLMSEECARRLCEMELIEEEYLSACVEVTVKHDVTLSVRNYYDKNSKIGCPEFFLEENASP